MLTYDEGLSVGYRDAAAARRGTRSATASATRRGSTSRIDAPGEGEPATACRRCVRVRNTGARRGREVVQVYASRADSAVERPARWLAGFATLTRTPGEAEATVTVARRAFEHWDNGWVLEPGNFQLAAGLSSAAQPVSIEITAS